MNHKLQQTSQLAPNGPLSFGLTELVLTGDRNQQMTLIMPMIAHLSQENGDRWLTWITASKPNREELKRFGVNTDRLRLIHTKEQKDQQWISWEALALGNSHTVIASPGKLSEKEFHQLESAAKRGISQGILIRTH